MSTGRTQGTRPGTGPSCKPGRPRRGGDYSPQIRPACEIVWWGTLPQEPPGSHERGNGRQAACHAPPPGTFPVRRRYSRRGLAEGQAVRGYWSRHPLFWGSIDWAASHVSALTIAGVTPGASLIYSGSCCIAGWSGVLSHRSKRWKSSWARPPACSISSWCGISSSWAVYRSKRPLGPSGAVRLCVPIRHGRPNALQDLIEENG